MPENCQLTIPDAAKFVVLRINYTEYHKHIFLENQKDFLRIAVHSAECFF